MREGDHSSEEKGIAHGAACADEIGGDYGLAVPRLQAVGRAEEEGQRQRPHDQPQVQLIRAQHIAESVCFPRFSSYCSDR